MDAAPPLPCPALPCPALLCSALPLPLPLPLPPLLCLARPIGRTPNPHAQRPAPVAPRQQLSAPGLPPRTLLAVLLSPTRPAAASTGLTSPDRPSSQPAHPASSPSQLTQPAPAARLVLLHAHCTRALACLLACLRACLCVVRRYASLQAVACLLACLPACLLAVLATTAPPTAARPPLFCAMPPRAPLQTSFSVADVNNEVVCPLRNQDGSHCRKRCLGVSLDVSFSRLLSLLRFAFLAFRCLSCYCPMLLLLAVIYSPSTHHLTFCRPYTTRETS